MMIPTEVTTLNIQAAASTVAFLFALLPGAIVALVFFFFLRLRLQNLKQTFSRQNPTTEFN